MVAVFLVKLDFGVVLAGIGPGLAHGRHPGAYLFGHALIAFFEQGSHAFVGADGGIIAAVVRIAVLAAPGHVQDDAGFGAEVPPDEPVEPADVAEELPPHPQDGHGGPLALVLEYDDVPSSLPDRRPGLLVVVMLLQRPSARCPHAEGEAVAGGFGQPLDDGRHLVGMGVAVADEEGAEELSLLVRRAVRHFCEVL